LAAHANLVAGTLIVDGTIDVFNRCLSDATPSEYVSDSRDVRPKSSPKLCGFMDRRLHAVSASSHKGIGLGQNKLG
jgi:hypothetical protein